MPHWPGDTAAAQDSDTVVSVRPVEVSPDGGLVSFRHSSSRPQPAALAITASARSTDELFLDMLSLAGDRVRAAPPLRPGVQETGPPAIGHACPRPGWRRRGGAWGIAAGEECRNGSRVRNAAIRERTA